MGTYTALWPKVMIGVITYDRLAEIKHTIVNLYSALIYPRDKVQWVISDDCTGPNYAQQIKKSLTGVVVAGGPDRKVNIPFEYISTPVRGGFGANANNLIRYFNKSDADYLLFIEDDKHVDGKLHMESSVALMQMDPCLGMLRYKSTCGTEVVLRQKEVDISTWNSRYKQGLGATGRMNYFIIDGSSPSLWLYTNGVHLLSKNFHRFYGMFPEGLKLGHTEEAFCHQVKNIMFMPGAPAIAILPEWIIERTEDRGLTYQGTELDV